MKKLIPLTLVGILTLTSGCSNNFFDKCKTLSKLGKGIDNYYPQEHYDAQKEELKQGFEKLNYH
jgi:hypothetical protein